MTARPIRRNAQTPDRNGKIFYTSTTSLSHISKICRNQCEILVLQSILENQGIGSALIKAVLNKAKQAYCETVWLITTNDNIHAIRYYQKFGFELAAVHINAIEESRKLKPTIPFFGNEKIPLKHEFEFQYKL